LPKVVRGEEWTGLVNGPGSPKLARWKHIIWVTSEPIQRSKGQKSRSPG